MTSDPPPGWERRRLGELLTLKRGYDLPAQDRRPGSIPIVSSSGVSGTHDIAKVSAPGVVTGRYGTIGEVFYIMQDFWPLNTALYVEDFKGNDPRYCSEVLRGLNFRAYDGKSSVPGVNRNDLHAAEILVAPRDEQRRISAVLGALDDKIDSNRRLAKLLEETAAALFRARFVDFVGVTDLVESEIGLIPRGWHVDGLAALATLVKDSVQPGSTPGALFQHFSIPAFDDGGGPEITEGSDIRSAKARVPATDCVLLSKLNPATKRVWWPRPGAAGAPVCSTEFLVLAPRGDVPNSYLYALLSGDERFHNELLSHVMGTTGSRQRVRGSDAMACRAVVPPAVPLGEWDSCARPLYDQTHAVAKESHTLAALRDTLLPRLISGQIRVPDSTDPDETIGPLREAIET